MTTQRHYSKAPITEAIIDLRVELPERITLADLEAIHPKEESNYPTKKNRYEVTGHMAFGRNVSVDASQEQKGFLFISEDEKQIFQAKLDGFTMSRLAPYNRWELFRDEARRLWDVYRQAVNPERVVRVAVRYVNRIDIPLKSLKDFGEYLLSVPVVSPQLPQGLTGYFMRLEIPFDDIRSHCYLNEAVIPPSSPNVVSIVLDVDVFRLEDAPQEEEEIWSFIEKLRDRKNSIFEACITDRARELFQ